MSGRANRRRGEVEAVIDGERRILCLTLGAIAELETAFGVDNIADLAGRFSGARLSARDVMTILAAGLRGGGNRLDDEDLADVSIEGGLEGAVRLTAELLASAFLTEAEGGSNSPFQPPAQGPTSPAPAFPGGR
ncbi:gene transfer agent family protein [Rhizobium sp. TRM95796]|uniref:gene transfer agent family protein n=1 Tax=Rhizobium sp. TRM95796 TaxID=2979862 RepID=UPI0021E6E473|nr:gene transfer agent family protein [Rhizobium sp. TRM95796]MCV3765615.1 gene transfer agent family protein [Rhizobium sp. TRM95796]